MFLTLKRVLCLIMVHANTETKEHAIMTYYDSVPLMDCIIKTELIRNIYTWTYISVDVDIMHQHYNKG